MLNNGLSASSGETRIVLQVNGIPKVEWILPDGLDTATYTTIEDYPLILSAGEHELRMTIDYREQIAESSEDDNHTQETWTWIDGQPVLRIEPGQIVHQIDGVSAGAMAMAAAVIDNPPLLNVKQLPVIDARLRQVMDAGLKSAYLPVVFSPTRRIDTAALQSELSSLDGRIRRETAMTALRRHLSQEKAQIQSALDDLIDRGQMEPARELWLPGMFFADMTVEAIEILAADSGVGWLWLDDTPSRTYSGASALESPSTNDSAAKASLAWHLTAIGADQAWARGFDGRGVLIGHLDSGICYDHPDLVNHLWDGGAEWPHHGYDAVDKDNDPYDADPDWRHGTHTAGLIVGDGTGGQTTGAAPGAELMALRVIPGYWNDLIEGMQFALDHGPVDLFTMSGGWGNPANDIKEANRMNADVLLNLDIPWVVAAGNGDNYGGHYDPPPGHQQPRRLPRSLVRQRRPFQRDRRGRR
jgi:subtilase family protein